MTEIQNLYQYIDYTKVRTAMYIGEHTISAMYFHINGYLTACYLKGIQEKLDPEFDEFNDFVANYYLRGESTAGWKNIILAECFGNEQSALEQFFELFDLFRAEKKPTNAKKILYTLINRLLSNPEILENIKIENTENLYSELISLPNNLEKIKFAFEYDTLLKSISQFAKKNRTLLVIMNDIKKLNE